MRARQQGVFDLTAPMPPKSEDDVKTERILMAEMIEQGPDPEAAERLELYKNEMRKAKALIRQYYRDNE